MVIEASGKSLPVSEIVHYVCTNLTFMPVRQILCATLALLAVVTAAVTAAGLMRRPPSVEEVVAEFLRDERIPGAVVAFGRVGAPPKVIALGRASAGRPMTT